MKKTLNTVLFVMLLFCVACSKDTNEINTEEEVCYYTPEDIEGVWVHPQNPLYFFSFSRNGRYSYCLNYKLMGSGTYTMKDNKVTLYNGYLGTAQELEIKNVTNEKIHIVGPFYYFKSNESIFCFYELNKSSETCPPSIMGKVLVGQMEPLYVYYDDTDAELIFSSDYIANYKLSGTHRKTGRYEIISRKSWYYVYRPPYTYTQKIDGDGNVVIYNLDDYCDIYHLDDYIVQQKY